MLLICAEETSDQTVQRENQNLNITSKQLFRYMPRAMGRKSANFFRKLTLQYSNKYIVQSYSARQLNGFFGKWGGLNIHYSTKILAQKSQQASLSTRQDWKCMGNDQHEQPHATTRLGESLKKFDETRNCFSPDGRLF